MPTSYSDITVDEGFFSIFVVQNEREAPRLAVELMIIAGLTSCLDQADRLRPVLALTPEPALS